MRVILPSNWSSTFFLLAPTVALSNSVTPIGSMCLANLFLHGPKTAGVVMDTAHVTQLRYVMIGSLTARRRCLSYDMLPRMETASAI